MQFISKQLVLTLVFTACRARRRHALNASQLRIRNEVKVADESISNSESRCMASGAGKWTVQGTRRLEWVSVAMAAKVCKCSHEKKKR